MIRTHSHTSSKPDPFEEEALRWSEKTLTTSAGDTRGFHTSFIVARAFELADVFSPCYKMSPQHTDRSTRTGMGHLPEAIFLPITSEFAFHQCVDAFVPIRWPTSVP